MADTRRRLTGFLVSGLLLGCSGPSDELETEGIDEVRQALSVCDESVPADRFIDGFPAYAQCDASQDSEIYSNNGVDTSPASLGPDWVRTQRSGGYQCTELAHRYLHFGWNVTWLPRGNAGTWCDSIPPDTSGVIQTTTPVHGDLIVLAPGSCGASTTSGHVAVIDTVEPTRLRAVQQNRASRGSYDLGCARCYLHVVANDGTPGRVGPGATGAGGAPAFVPPPIGGASGAPAPPPPPPMGGASGAGGVGTSAGTGGAAAAPNGAGGAGGPIDPGDDPGASSASDEGGCRVSSPGAATGAAPHPLALVALALAGLFAWRRGPTARPRGSRTRSSPR